tara:strand:- start:371 stop:517 length:147 start_codon:yes stop_codon:yes gene_type:complete
MLGAACCAGALCAVSCTSLLRGMDTPAVVAAPARATERRRGADAATLV